VLPTGTRTSVTDGSYLAQLQPQARLTPYLAPSHSSLLRRFSLFLRRGHPYCNATASGRSNTGCPSADTVVRQAACFAPGVVNIVSSAASAVIRSFLGTSHHSPASSPSFSDPLEHVRKGTGPSSTATPASAHHQDYVPGVLSKSAITTVSFSVTVAALAAGLPNVNAILNAAIIPAATSPQSGRRISRKFLAFRSNSPILAWRTTLQATLPSNPDADFRRG